MRGLALLLAAVAAPHWTATDIGLGEGFVHAVGVDAHGTVICVSTTNVGSPQARTQAFLWRRGKPTLLRYGGARNVDVTAIDDRGDVVGDAGTMGVLWRNGRPTALGRDFTPTALDAAGSVIGQRRGRALVWRQGRLTDLGTLGGGATTANAVDDRGRIVGNSDVVPEQSSHAFLWQNGTMTDLGGLGSLDTTAVALDDAGTIVGFASDHVGASRIAVEWKDGRLVELGRFGAPGAQAVAVDRAGDVLVQTQQRNGDPKGIRLLRGGRTIAIPVPGGGHAVAEALDDAGDVLGSFQGPRLGRRSFVWRNGVTMLLPTTDGREPPWGGPVAIAGGYAVGDEYVALKGGGTTSHAVLWRLTSSSRHPGS